MDWNNRDEAIRYFGLGSEAELEDVVIDFNLDVEVDNDGRIINVEAGDNAKVALFALHEMNVGHNPMDEEQAAIQAEKRERHEKYEAKKRRDRRALLHKRLEERHG